MRRLATILVLCSACSFAFVSGPPPNHRQLQMFDCSTSRIAPVIDTVWAALMTLDFIGATASSDTQWHDLYCKSGDTSCSPPLTRGAAIPTYAVLAVVAGGAAYYGYTRTGECRAAKQELMARSLGGPPGAAQGPGTWPPPAPAPVPAPAPAPNPAPAPPPAP